MGRKQKHNVWTIVLVATICSIVLAAPAKAQTITNGNFEASTVANPPSGWITYMQTSRSGAWTIQAGTPPQGTLWQQTQVYNTGAFGGIRQNVTGLTSGLVYTISGTYKTNSASATAAVRYNLSGNTNRANSTVLVSKVATSWGTFSADVTATGASMMLFLDHQNGTSANKASGFDNIKVTAASDTTPPTVSSIVRKTPSSQNTNASSVVWTVTFSEMINATTVSTSDFTLTDVNTTITGESVTGVTPTTGTATAFDVTCGTGSAGSGTLRLDVLGAATIQDVAGNDITASYTSGATYIIDKTAPGITSGTLAATNAYVDVVMSEGVYTTAGSGALVVADFTCTFAANGGTATAASISSLTNTSGGAVAAGDSTIRVNLTITGTPNGQETVTIKPASAASIYDLVGNAMLGTETTGALNLYDQSWGIKNGTFEGGWAGTLGGLTGSVPTQWIGYLQGSTAGNSSMQGATPPQGTAWTQIQITTANKYGGIYQNVTGHNIGRIYKVTGSYKTNSASATVQLFVDTNGGTDPAAAEFKPTGTNSDAWSTFSEVFCAKGSSVTYFLHTAVTTVNKAGGFDNILLTPGPANKIPSAADSTVCSGTGTNIVIPASESGTTYQLQTEAGTNVGSALSGTGSNLNLPTGNLTTETTFKVLATRGFANYMYEAYDVQPLVVKLMTVTVVAAPTASAGSDQTIYVGGTTAGLGGNTPTSPATGAWSVVSGGNGTFSPNNTTPDATFTDTAGTGPVTLRWTVSNSPCTAATDDVVVTVNALPSYCLYNGSFDSGFSGNGWADGWTKAAPGTNGTWAQESITIISSPKSQSISDVFGLPYFTDALYQTVSVRNGKNYVFDLWIHSINGATAAVGLNSNGSTVPSLSQALTTADTWTHRQEPFTAGSSGLATIAIGAGYQSGEGTAYFDDISLTPAKPTTTGGATTICSGDSTNITASGGYQASADSNLKWYTGTNGTGTLAGSGSPLSVSPTTTTTYYPRWEIVESCGTLASDDGAGVTITVSPDPTAPTSAGVNRDGFCASDTGDISLSVSGGSGTTVQWFTGSCGGTAAGTGNPNVIASPTESTTYYARWENSCGESTCANVDVTVNPLPGVATDGTAVADSTTQITWGWTPDAGLTGEVYKLYNSSTGGTALATSEEDATYMSESDLVANTLYGIGGGSGANARYLETYDGCTSSSRLALPAVHTLAKAPTYGTSGDVTIQCDHGQTDTACTPGADITFTFNNAFDSGAANVGQFGYLWDQSSGDPSSWTGESLWTSGTTLVPQAGSAGQSYYLHIRSYNNDSTKVENSTVLNLGPYTAVSSCAAVLITADPDNQSACEPTEAQFSVSVSGGTPITFQWQKSTDSGSNWTPITTGDGSGYDTAVYTTPATSDTMDGYMYRCYVTNCVSDSDISAAATLTVNPSPAAKTVSAEESAVCSGSGTNIQVAASESGVSYQLKTEAGDAVGDPVVGDGNAVYLPTGNLTAETQFKVEATLGTCVTTMATHPTVTIDPLPAAKTVSAEESSVCSGSGTNIQVADSESGVSYQLKTEAGDSVGDPVAGTGSTINLPTGDLSAETQFKVEATTSLGCVATMASHPTVTVNPSPAAKTVSAEESSVCSGSGTNIQVAASESGVSYQLKTEAGDSVGSPVSGTGDTIDLPTGNMSAETQFKVEATLSGCIVTMANHPTVTVNPVPTGKTVSAQASSVCYGSGTNIQVAASESGVSYQLKTEAGDSVGSPVSGTGDTIDLPTGNLTTTTQYKVEATLSGCAATMAVHPTVTVNAIPDAPVAATATPITETSITWNWEAVSGCTYRLWTEATGGTQVGGDISATNYQESPLLGPGASHDRYVEAVSSGCTSTTRTKLSATTTVRYCLNNTTMEQFTGGVATDWSAFQEAGTNSVYASSGTDEGYGGTGYAQKVTLTSQGNIAYMFQKFTAKANRQYEVSAKMMQDNTNYYIRAYMAADTNGGSASKIEGVNQLTQWFDSSTNNGYNSNSADPIVANTWYTMTMTNNNTGTAPISRATDGPITVFLGGWAKSGSNHWVRIDNVSVVPAKPESALVDGESSTSYCTDNVPAGTLQLSVTGGYGDATSVHWYTDANCTTALLEGSNPVIGSPVSITPPTNAGTYHYYGRYEADCASSATKSVTVTVNGTFSVGTVTGGGGAFCNSTDPAEMTYGGGSGGGALGYQWYSVAGTGAPTTGDTLIEGATSSSYDPPSGLTATTTYNVLVTPTCGAPAFSTTPVTVTVNALPAAPTGGSATADSTTQITWGWTAPAGSGYRYDGYNAASGPTWIWTTGAFNDTTSKSVSSLTANTQYQYWVETLKGDCISATRLELPAKYTLAKVGIAADKNLTCDKSTGTIYSVGTTFTFSNPVGFGTGGEWKASSFEYKWNTTATETWSSAGTAWSSDTLPQTPTEEGDYYLHVRAINGDSTANSTDVANYGPFKVYDGLTVVSWSSVKTQGAGTYPALMNPSKTGTGADSPFIEPRRGDVRIRVVFSHATATVSSNQVTVTGATVTPTLTQVSGTTWDIVLANPTSTNPLHRKRLTIALAGTIHRSVSESLLLGGDNDCQIRVLHGDVNQNGSVSTTDIGLVRMKMGPPPNGFNGMVSTAEGYANSWLFDVNLSGSINTTDMALVRSLDGHSVE